MLSQILLCLNCIVFCCSFEINDKIFGDKMFDDKIFGDMFTFQTSFETMNWMEAVQASIVKIY